MGGGDKGTLKREGWGFFDWNGYCLIKSPGCFENFSFDPTIFCGQCLIMLMLELVNYSWLPIGQQSSRDFISHRNSSHWFISLVNYTPRVISYG
jgi:hypothetical protein